MTAALRVGPQVGPQTRAMECQADILIYGGEAGAGKTYMLCLEPMRHCRNEKFNAVLFRRTMPQITNPGGPWDESHELYHKAEATPRESPRHEWTFPSGATVLMAGLQYEKDVEDWTGSQIALLLFDQLELFTEHQFFYMLSRNRSMCGVRPYVRATCNPQPGWLADFIAWWIDDAGWPRPERDGVLRWMVRYEEKIIWGNSWEELYRQMPDHVLRPGINPEDEPHKLIPKSVTFIAGSVYDNKILLSRNPEYLSNLMGLPRVERMRLLGEAGKKGGNWKVRPLLGMMFGEADFKLVDDIPSLDQFHALVRYWDKAGSEHKTEEAAKHAHTTGVLLGRLGSDPRSNKIFVLNVKRGQWQYHEREIIIRQTAEDDGHRVIVWHEQEPGSGGKESAQATNVNLSGYAVYADKVTGSKVERAVPWSACVQAGNAYVPRNAPWRKQYIDEHVGFTPTSLVKDLVDASAGAYNKISATVPWRTHNRAY